MKNKYLLALLPILCSLCGCNEKVSYDTKKYELNINFENENFKIMQLTDIHLGIEVNNELEMNQVGKYISLINPDLVVITGDTFLNANENIVNYFISMMDSFNVKWTFTYGNHDNQGDYDDYYINKSIMKNSKNALFIDYKDDDLTGKTNFYINLKKDNKTLYRLYIVDSNSYYFNGFKYKYDVIHEEQLEHIKKINDLDNAYGLAFFHIPFVEYQETYERYIKGETKGQGTNFEKCCPPYTNNGALKKMYNSGIRASFVGHDHINYSDVVYDKFDEEFIMSYGVKATKTIYANDDLIGCKLINLKSSTIGLELEDIEAKLYGYSI